MRDSNSDSTMSSATSTDPGLRPWQLFLLAGMLAATAVVLVSKGRPTSSIVVLSITVVSASLVAVAAFRSLAPLVAAEDLEPEAPAGGRTRAALEREKALVLRSIKELEFDHAMRKTAGAEYEEMRDRLKLRAVGLLRQLDQSGYREAVERDLAARGGAAAAPAAPAPSAPASPVVPQAPVAPVPPPVTTDTMAPPVAVAVAARRCGACHALNELDARFCKACGVALAGPA